MTRAPKRHAVATQPTVTIVGVLLIMSFWLPTGLLSAWSWESGALRLLSALLQLFVGVGLVALPRLPLEREARGAALLISAGLIGCAWIGAAASLSPINAPGPWALLLAQGSLVTVAVTAALLSVHRKLLSLGVVSGAAMMLLGVLPLASIRPWSAPLFFLFVDHPLPWGFSALAILIAGLGPVLGGGLLFERVARLKHALPERSRDLGLISAVAFALWLPLLALIDGLGRWAAHDLTPTTTLAIQAPLFGVAALTALGFKQLIDVWIEDPGRARVFLPALLRLFDRPQAASSDPVALVSDTREAPSAPALAPTPPPMIPEAPAEAPLPSASPGLPRDEQIEHHWNSANQAWYDQRWLEALEHYRRVTLLDANHAEAYRAVADIHYGLNELNEAEMYYQRVLKIWPGDEYVLQVLEKIKNYQQSPQH